MRLFFALWPSAAECAALSAWHSPLRKLCGGRVMRTDTLHSTLVFLGDVEESRLEVLRLVAKGSNCRGFELKLTTAHYWGHNHIVYAAPDETPLATRRTGARAGNQAAQAPLSYRKSGLQAACHPVAQCAVERHAIAENARSDLEIQRLRAGAITA